MEQLKQYKRLFGLPVFEFPEEVKGIDECVMRLAVVDVLGASLLPEEAFPSMTFSVDQDIFAQVEILLKTRFSHSVILQIVPLAISRQPHEGVIFMVVLSDHLERKRAQPSSSISPIEQSLLKMCEERTRAAQHSSPIEETLASESLGWRLFVHRYLVKPLYYIGSNLLIRRKVLHVASSILSLGKNSVVCDVACGYDDLSLNVARRAGAAVILNDATSKPLFAAARKNTYAKTVYQVQTVHELDIAQLVDLVICKNVVHHMETREEIDLLLARIARQARNAIIIDPCDPRSTFLGRFWNNYYRFFLLDQGHSFLTFDLFERRIRNAFPTKEILLNKVWTVKGPFMVAVIKENAV